MRVILLYISAVSWWTTRNMYIYIKYKSTFLFLTIILVWSRRVIVESSHTRRGRRESEEPVNNWLYQNSGTCIVYNSHVTCSNPSFSLVMVTPTSHFFILHWLQFTSMCSLFPIHYLLKLTSKGRRICYYSPSSTPSIGQGHIPIITLLILSSAEAVNNIRRYTTPAVTFIYYNTIQPIKTFVLDRNKWNHLTVWERTSSVSFKNFINKMCFEIIYLIYICIKMI